MDCCSNKKSMMDRVRDALAGKIKPNISEGIATRKVALVGSPNVGKSVIFNSLTGAYVTVSNYPGTTVEVSKGHYESDGLKLEIMDTPGMYSMLPITEEERVTRKVLMTEMPDLVLHVVDAKNIDRMLPMTLQLIEAGFQVILVLNIMDEAETLGLKIDITELQHGLGIPVVSASAALNKGIDEVKKSIRNKIIRAA